MTAEYLRETAQMMRDQHGLEHVRHVFWSELANWLESVATRHTIESAPTGGDDFFSFCAGCQREIDEIEQCPDFASALAVVKAYREGS